jgi:hypothetical protein
MMALTICGESDASDSVMRTERSLQPSREAIASVLSTLAAIRSSRQDRAVARRPAGFSCGISQHEGTAGALKVFGTRDLRTHGAEKILLRRGATAHVTRP